MHTFPFFRFFPLDELRVELRHLIIAHQSSARGCEADSEKDAQRDRNLSDSDVADTPTSVFAYLDDTIMGVPPESIFEVRKSKR